VLLCSPGYKRTMTDNRLFVCAVPIRVIQATLILQYLAAGIAKAFRGDWLKYSDVLYTQVQGVYRTEIAAWMLRNLPVWAWTVMQWISLLFELEAVVLFTVRKLRWIAFTVGMGFHLMIALLMKDLIFFSLQMWSFYALWITADEYRAAWGWLRRCGRECSWAGGSRWVNFRGPQ
jgi:Vitamin K-dependent gamma-carboxylase